MPAYKRQHYIPQFYLKNFTIDRRKIQAYNLATKKFNKINCSEVCSKDYFYGQMPAIERTFSGLESECSRIMSNIIRENNLSKITVNDYCILLFLLSFQYARTLKLKMEVEQYFNKISNNIFRSIIDGKNLKIVVNGPIHAYAIKSIMESGPYLIKDLTPILFVNFTKRDFITSDNPIILYNSFFNNPEGHFLYPPSGTTGLQSPGLQIFWPLDTKHMLVLYDKEFYNFKVASNKCVKICLEKDIDALNSMQFFSCSNNIFFADQSQNENIKSLHSKYKDLINEEYQAIDTIKRTKSNGQESEIVNTYTRDINYRLILSFMYFNMNATAIDIARDFSICDLVDQLFMEEDEQFDQLFHLGKFVFTEGGDRILDLEEPDEDLVDLLKRHVSGDWGEVSQDQKDCNDKAIKDGSRIMSAYTLSTGKKIIILTEASNELGHRKVTRILASEEVDLFDKANYCQESDE